MQDTPEHIKKLQLKIWMQKTAAERLYHTLKSNEELFLFWKEGKAAVKKVNSKQK